MAVQLVLRRPVPTPAAQLRVVWQGHRDGDLAQAGWTESAGAVHDWPGASGVRWIQRDSLRQGEEWKVNLPGVPDTIGRIVLRLTTTAARSVGVVVFPLTGSPDDAVQHPGAELGPGEPRELLEFTRSGRGWLVTALNAAVLDEAADSAPRAARTPTPEPRPEPTGDPAFPGWPAPVTDHAMDARPAAGGRAPESPEVSTTVAGATRPKPAPPQSRPAEDSGPPVLIPARLEQAVDAARATGSTRSRTRVGAVVDLSASMRPWIVSGQLADVLTAVQAVAGASNRPSVATRFLPGDREVDLQLATEPADVLGTHLTASGLRTGDRATLMAAADLAESRGGLTMLITDDASLATGPGVTVVLGPDPTGGFVPASPAPVVSVPAGPVDVLRLARRLADVTAS